MSVLKRLVATLPEAIQFELESQLRRWQIRRGRYVADEPELALLPDLIRPGDWVLDIGANIGHYTLELARLVGSAGRVVALEPTRRAFAQLSAMVVRADLENVTLINAAASRRAGIVSMSVPLSPDGLPSFYDARIDEGEGGDRAMAIRIDDLPLSEPVSLIKIDVEGHEPAVLEGARDLIERWRPVLLIEESSDAVERFLAPLGYRSEKLPGSPNRLWRPGPDLD